MFYTNWISDYSVSLNNIFSSLVQPFYTKAKNDLKWIIVMDAKIKALKTMTLAILFLYPPNRNVIGCIWMFKTKCNFDGIVERSKPRVVARCDKERRIFNLFLDMLLNLQLTELLMFWMLLWLAFIIIGYQYYVFAWLSRWRY